MAWEGELGSVALRLSHIKLSLVVKTWGESAWGEGGSGKPWNTMQHVPTGSDTNAHVA